MNNFSAQIDTNGEDFAEESFIRGTLLSNILIVCAGLEVFLKKCIHVFIIGNHNFA